MSGHYHDMPWGASVDEAGEVRFGLWAPSAERVDVLLERRNGVEVLTATADGAGWWTQRSGIAGVGDRYRYRIDGALEVPDPASRFQPEDCQGPSQIQDPRSYVWRNDDWRGRPWHETACYELHIGTFTREGTYAAAAARLDDLAALGVTAVELMPLSDFPGERNWGYDGVLPFAPDSAYGTPDELKAFIDAAHDRGLMVFLDVVYNHFGPDGNYLGNYAAAMFTDRHQTPWGAAINFDTGPESRWVRRFFIDNVLYWLTEFRFDGLRFDAVHAIRDDSERHILSEIAAAVRDGPGVERHVHLILENDANEARWLRGLAADASAYDAQWNDDLHHALHAAVTGEQDGYYADFHPPAPHLARALAEGFAYQGDASAFRAGERRGEPSAMLPPTAFVNFLQNHDQVGNRAFGDRIHEQADADALRAATTVLLLAPSPPMLFMGQEWCATSPFPFFCDFEGELAQAVTDGRRREFAGFAAFSDESARARIPDPNAADTFESAQLDWDERSSAPHDAWLALHRELLALRAREITPRLVVPPGSADSGRVPMQTDHEDRWQVLGDTAFRVRWQLADGSCLELYANLGEASAPDVVLPDATTRRLLYRMAPAGSAGAAGLPAWSALYYLGAQAGA